MQPKRTSKPLIFKIVQVRFVSFLLLLSLCFYLETTAMAQVPVIERARGGSAPRTTNEQQTIDAYKKVNKAVVHINTSQASYDGYFGVNYRRGMGSGVIIDSKNALVITNYHVVQNAQRVSVTLADGKTFPAIKVGLDKENDIALLQIDQAPENLVAGELADSDALEIGQRVMAIGNPFGLDRTLTTGIISSLERTVELNKGEFMDNLIQTDAAINQGNSGGPLLDSLGRVIGINTFIFSRTGESAGIGFAIPINQIKRAIPQLAKYGRILKPKLGVSLRETEWGLIVVYAQPNGPAAKAGISGALRKARRGRYVGTYLDPSVSDYIIAVNGEKVKSKAQALDLIGKTPFGQKVVLDVRKGLRNDRTRRVIIEPVLD